MIEFKHATRIPSRRNMKGQIISTMISKYGTIFLALLAMVILILIVLARLKPYGV